MGLFSAIFGNKSNGKKSKFDHCWKCGANITKDLARSNRRLCVPCSEKVYPDNALDAVCVRLKAFDDVCDRLMTQALLAFDDISDPVVRVSAAYVMTSDTLVKEYGLSTNEANQVLRRYMARR